MSTWFRVVASNGVCTSATSVAIKITVNPAKATTITVPTGDICFGSTKVLTLPTGYVGTIQWQTSRDNSNFTTIASAVAATYTVPATTAVGANYYRAVLTSGACSITATSNTLTVNVIAKSVAGTISGAATVCTGANSTTLTLANSTGTIQWQSASPSATSTYSNIANATSATYIASGLSATTFYKAVVTNGVVCAAATTTAVGVTVSPIAVATSVTGGDVSICNGTTKVLTLASGYTGTIKWQSSATPDGNYSVIALATAATYTVPASLSANTTYYRALLTSGACTATTSPVAVTVRPAVNAGTISGTASVCYGLTSTLAVDGNDSGSTIQWQKATTLTGVYANINFATSTTYATPALTATSYYKAIVSNNGCSSGSAGYGVTVNPLAKVTTISGSVSAITAASAICTSASQTLTLATGYVGTIQWQYASSATAPSWTDIASANATTLAASSYVTVVGATTATYFRVKMTNSCATVAYSAAVAVFYKNCPIATKTIVAPFDVKAYPNPFSNNFNLNVTTSSSENVEVRVYDMIGKLINKLDFNPSNASEIQIGNNYPSGIYNVIVTQGTEVSTLKVIKK